MTNETEISNAAKAKQLELMIKQTELGADLEAVLRELIPPENPWWAGQTSTQAAETAPRLAPDHLPWFNRMSSIVGVVADFRRLAERISSHVATRNGMMMGAAAASLDGRRQVDFDYCTWRQGDLKLTLALDGDDSVTLSIDDGPDVEIGRLGWIDEEALGGDPHAVAQLQRFDVSRTGARLFAVGAPSGDVSDRLAAIKAAETTGAENLFALLPFVEWT